MANFKPVTEERLSTGDDYRAQVHFHTRRDKMLYASLSRLITAMSEQTAAEVRDSGGPNIIARAIETARDFSKQEKFQFLALGKQGDNGLLKELFPDPALYEEMIAILKEERIL